MSSDRDAKLIPTRLIMMLITQFILTRNDANIIDLTPRLHRKVVIDALSAALSSVTAGVWVGYFKLGITGLVGRFILRMN